jgi:hypothetical protein
MIRGNMTLPTTSRLVLVTTLSIIFCLIGSNHGQNEPVTTTTTTTTTQSMVPLNSKCGPTNDQYCYVQEAINYILNGNNDNKTSTTSPLDIIPDEETLEWLILLGLQQLSVAMDNNPQYRPG